MLLFIYAIGILAQNAHHSPVAAHIIANRMYGIGTARFGSFWTKLISQKMHSSEEMPVTDNKHCFHYRKAFYFQPRFFLKIFTAIFCRLKREIIWNEYFPYWLKIVFFLLCFTPKIDRRPVHMIMCLLT